MENTGFKHKLENLEDKGEKIINILQNKIKLIGAVILVAMDKKSA